MQNKTNFQMDLSEIRTKLEQRAKLVKAQEFFAHEYESAKGQAKRDVQMKYFGLNNHIKQLDFEIQVKMIEIEHGEVSPSSPLSPEAKLASWKTMVVG